MMERKAINRHSVLAGAAIALPALTGERLSAAPTDPARALVERWKAVHDHLNNYPSDIPNDDPVWDINKGLEIKISETRAQTLDGLAAQLEFAADESIDFDDTCAIGKRLYQNMQAALQSLAVRAV